MGWRREHQVSGERGHIRHVGGGRASGWRWYQNRCWVGSTWRRWPVPTTGRSHQCLHHRARNKWHCSHVRPFRPSDECSSLPNEFRGERAVPSYFVKCAATAIESFSFLRGVLDYRYGRGECDVQRPGDGAPHVTAAGRDPLAAFACGASRLPHAAR